MPFVLAAACSQVVLDNSEKAKHIYNEAVETWARKDCHAVLNDTKIPFSSIIAAIEAVTSKKVSDWDIN